MEVLGNVFGILMFLPWVFIAIMPLVLGVTIPIYATKKILEKK